MEINKIKIERVIMSGKGPRITYKLVYEGKNMFSTAIGSYLAWTRKKDAQKIIEALEIHGVDYVESKLKYKAL